MALSSLLKQWASVETEAEHKMSDVTGVKDVEVISPDVTNLELQVEDFSVKVEGRKRSQNFAQRTI